jgi:hypothetical protein
MVAKKMLFWTAVTGWGLSVTVHLLSWADVDVKSWFPAVWLLHIGIFVVWIPAILQLRKNPAFQLQRQSGLMQRLNPIESFKAMFIGTPKWLTIIAIVGFYYAVANFMIFMVLIHNGSPAIQDGQFVLQNHGQVLSAISEKEFHHFEAVETRGFSGHWIAFYGLAMAILYPWKNQNPSGG